MFLLCERKKYIVHLLIISHPRLMFCNRRFLNALCWLKGNTLNMIGLANFRTQAVSPAQWLTSSTWTHLPTLLLPQTYRVVRIKTRNKYKNHCLYMTGTLFHFCLLSHLLCRPLCQALTGVSILSGNSYLQRREQRESTPQNPLSRWKGALRGSVSISEVEQTDNDWQPEGDKAFQPVPPAEH